MTFAFIIPCAVNDLANTPITNETGASSLPATTAPAEGACGPLLATINSINQYAKGSLISVIEHGATALHEDQKADLLKQVDILMEYNANETIQKIIDQFPDRKDSLNLTELTSLIWFLEVAQQHQVFKQVKRLFFIRPGQTFDPAVHALAANKPEAKNKFILPNSYPSPYPSEQTGHIFLQFNTRLWSFETSQIAALLDSLRDMLTFMQQHTQKDSHVDLGHCLYKFIDASHIFYDLGLPSNPN